MFKLLQLMRPSRNPQSSASKLVVTPIRLENPAIHLPFSSLITPPQPAKPGLPLEAPSVFNFFQPACGFSHLTLLMMLQVRSLGDDAQYMNSIPWFTVTSAKFGFGFFPQKTHPFLLFHIFHNAKGKIIFQGKIPAVPLYIHSLGFHHVFLLFLLSCQMN